ncbi:MAG: glutathione S-transferase [Solirubrobacteraceae bacterium]|jgi:glutathione S-transferase|nr:glutathione S-transferase [Solirubrobacteraceae bacterium]
MSSPADRRPVEADPARTARTAPAVRIHGYPISTWTRTVVMTCIEKGIDHELVPVDRGSPRHGELHPFHRMPILETGAATIIETLAITGYLDEAFPGPPLQPADPLERARMRTWMGICADYLFRDVVRAIPRERPPSAQELAGARTALERIESLVPDSPYLAGDTLTLADLYLAPQLSNGQEKAPELLDGLDALIAWASRVWRRESFQRTRYTIPA